MVCSTSNSEYINSLSGVPEEDKPIYILRNNDTNKSVGVRCGHFWKIAHQTADGFDVGFHAIQENDWWKYKNER